LAWLKPREREVAMGGGEVGRTCMVIGRLACCFGAGEADHLSC